MKMLLLPASFFVFVLTASGVFAADTQSSSFSLDYSKTDGSVPHLHYSQDGKYAVPRYQGKQFNLQLWKIDEEHHFKPYLVHAISEQVTAAKLTAEPRQVVSATGVVLSLWTIKNDQLEKIATEKLQNPIVQLTMSENGNLVLSEDSLGGIRVHEITNNGFELAASLEQKSSLFSGFLTDSSSQDSKTQAHRFAFHPQGDAFLKGDNTGTITSYLMHATELKEAQKIKIFNKAVTALIFTSNDSLLALAADGALESWRWSNGGLSNAQVLRQGTLSNVKHVAQARLSLSGDGQKFISRDMDGTILLWVLRENQWRKGSELVHPQKDGYQDVFFRQNVALLWMVNREWATPNSRHLLNYDLKALPSVLVALQAFGQGFCVFMIASYITINAKLL